MGTRLLIHPCAAWFEQAHRPYSDVDAHFLRRVARAGPNDLPHGSNPGLRVEDAFVDAEVGLGNFKE